MTIQPDTYLSELADPAFREKLKGIAERDEADFTAWVSEDTVARLVDDALNAAKLAFTAAAHVSEEGNPDRWALLAIDLAHPRARPLVQGLSGKGIGGPEIATFTYEVQLGDILGKRKRGRTKAQEVATLEAFALALSEPGFELHLLREEP